MKTQSLVNVIDKAAKLCGSQNKLAAQIGTYSGALAAAKFGHRPITTAQLEALAQIVGMDPAELWLIAQDARNPFRVSRPGELVAYVCAILSLLWMLTASPDAQATTRVSGAQSVPFQADRNIHCGVLKLAAGQHFNYS